MTIEERLREMLDAKDTEIEALQERVNELEERLDGVRNGWAAHSKIAASGLPMPRLEFVWTPRAPGDWTEFAVAYRLVYRHLLGDCVAVPLGLTRSGSSQGDAPWVYSDNPRAWLPFRDGAHALSDARHLGYPLYAHGPNGPVLIDPRKEASDAR